jgi:hypothetical protein
VHLHRPSEDEGSMFLKTQYPPNRLCSPAGVKGTSAMSGHRSGHRREAMAPVRFGPGMGQPIGVTAEGWWVRSHRSAAILSRVHECVICSFFSLKTVCAR